MEPLDLLWICGVAISAVFIVLTLLALLMRLLIYVFPADFTTEPDHALYAAIATSHNKFYPGKIITKIEELK